MAKSKPEQKAEETHQAGELPAVTHEAPTPTINPEEVEEFRAALEEAGGPEPEPEPDYKTKTAADYDGEALLRMLPRPNFQRITSLSVGKHWIANTEHGNFVFVRGAATLYAAGFLGKDNTMTQEELRELVKCCARGPGGNVYTLGDFLRELRRRTGGNN